MPDVDLLADVRLDPNTWDIALTQRANGLSDISLLTGAQRVRQAIGIRLRTWYQEWVFDETIGIPFLSQILIKNPSMPNIESIFQGQILSVVGVTGIVTLTTQVDAVARSLAVVYTAGTAYGNVSDIVPMQQANT